MTVPRTPLRYGLYVMLYTLFWIAISVVAYRTFFLEFARLAPGVYFFLAGMWRLVCGVVRAQHNRQKNVVRDPIVTSFAISGLLLILFANFT